MGFWNKLGKIALQAAPYVAAPFTGGASLMATGATQKLGQKWAEHDAKKAIEKGLAPSKFDKYLGMASTAAGLGSSFTGGFGLGSLGSKGASAASNAAGAASNVGKVANTAGKLTGWQKNLATAGKIGSTVLGNAPMGAGTEASGNPNNGIGGWQGALAAGLGQALQNQGGGSNAPRSEDLPDPNRANTGVAAPRRPGLASMFSAGRNEAVANQPFRRGYDTVVQGDDDTTLTQRMPQIYPNYGPPPSDDGAAPPSVFNQAPTPIANRFADELSPRRVARKRNPELVEE